MTRFFGLALLAVLVVGAGCTSSSTVDVTRDTNPETSQITAEDNNGGTGTAIDVDLSGDMIDTTVDGEVDATVGEVKEFTVEGGNFAFEPNMIKVKKGDTVRITFKNLEGFHDLKIDEFNVATKQIAADATETVEFVADKAGSFEYYCSVGKHREMGMVGTLVVSE